MTKLTKRESEWIARVQEVLDDCPNNRLGFYTVGDNDIVIYDHNKEDKINEIMDNNDRTDFGSAVDSCNARLGDLIFPNHVHSTSG